MKTVEFKLSLEFEDNIDPKHFTEITRKVVEALGQQASASESGLAPEEAETFTNGIFVEHESGVKSEGTLTINGREVITTDAEGNQKISKGF